ncbi:unnamed protein product [Rhodiola kirilowii]
MELMFREELRLAFPKENELVVKSQILTGGRGLGTFKSGWPEGWCAHSQEGPGSRHSWEDAWADIGHQTN